ncbi:MAG: hypothetical protein ACK52U_01310, partial [Synechococcaceae cyanobacterium]
APAGASRFRDQTDLSLDPALQHWRLIVVEDHHQPGHVRVIRLALLEIIDLQLCREAAGAVNLVINDDIHESRPSERQISCQQSLTWTLAMVFMNLSRIILVEGGK